MYTRYMYTLEVEDLSYVMLLNSSGKSFIFYIF